MNWRQYTHTLQSLVLNRSHHRLRQRLHGVLQRIMRQRDGTASVKSSLIAGDAVLDQRRRSVLPVKGVNVNLDDMISEATQDGQSSGAGAQVRRAHVGRSLSHDADECVLELGHLACDEGLVDGSQIRVTPSVYCEADSRSRTAGSGNRTRSTYV